jgi:hypothetical protein
VDAGGLMSYGVDLLRFESALLRPMWTRFKGAKPADLPVEQPTKFELVINLKTAKALGLTIPQSLLDARGRGDSVISRRWLLVCAAIAMLANSSRLLCASAGEGLPRRLPQLSRGAFGGRRGLCQWDA